MPDGTGSAFSLIGVGGDHVGLSHPVALQDAMSSALFKGQVSFGEQGSTT